MPENNPLGQSQSNEMATAVVLGEILGGMKAVQKTQEQQRADAKEQRDEVTKRLDQIDSDISAKLDKVGSRIDALDLRVNAVEKWGTRLSTIAMIMSAAMPIVIGLILFAITGAV